VLRKTLESVSGTCNEIIYGDMLLWNDDREIVESYKKDFNLKIVPFGFNYLYHRGFSDCLNNMALYASNDMVLYLNTSEIIEENYGIRKIINDNSDCNSFFFIHKTDPHRWFRLYNKNQLRWSGIIHEQLMGDYIPYHKPVFMMADLPKDMEDINKAKILDSLKEIVYFRQYMNIIDKPELLGETDPGWVNFSRDNYQSFKDRLNQRFHQVTAVETGDLNGFLNAAKYDIKNQTFKSSIAIEYQNDPAYLDKK
jgi:hypothetical protein